VTYVVDGWSPGILETGCLQNPAYRPARRDLRSLTWGFIIEMCPKCPSGSVPGQQHAELFAFPQASATQGSYGNSSTKSLSVEAFRVLRNRVRAVSACFVAARAVPLAIRSALCAVVWPEAGRRRVVSPGSAGEDGRHICGATVARGCRILA
jgi:hypothetical protein